MKSGLETLTRNMVIPCLVRQSQRPAVYVLWSYIILLTGAQISTHIHIFRNFCLCFSMVGP